MRKILLVGLSAFALGVGAMASADQLARPKPLENYKMLELFGDVLATVKKQYVVPVDDKKLIEAAINGMLTSLDPHSDYLNAESFTNIREETKGQYGGLGLEVTTEDGAVKIISPMDSTPAAKAGLMSGDYISAIDGNSILGVNLNDAVRQMRGAPGSSVTLTIIREKHDPFTVKLTREIISVKTVVFKSLDDVAYLRVSGFEEPTGKEVEKALRALKSKNSHLKGLILDLRNNPGGLVDASVEVASAFLDGGEIVSQRGRELKDIERYNANPSGDQIRGIPIVVLINSGTASAAEIVAGALKDRQRATVIGLTSFGKGSVQVILPLHNGEDGALKLTTARYYTPSGQSIQKTGIIPDLMVARSKEEAEAVTDAALQYSEANFKNALDSQEGRLRRAPERIEIPSEPLDNNHDKAKGLDKASRSSHSATEITEEVLKKDFQVQRALDILRFGSIAAAQKQKPATIFTPPLSPFAKIKAQSSEGSGAKSSDGEDKLPVKPDGLTPSPPSQTP